jgi:hypothetical protein
LGLGVVNHIAKGPVLHGQYHLDAGGVDAVYQILGRQHMGGGYQHRAHFMGRHSEVPVFIPAFDHDHTYIVFFDTQPNKGVGHLVALALYLGKGDDFFLAPVVAPYDGCFIWLFLSQTVHDIEAEVKILGDGNPEVLIIILIGRKIRPAIVVY